MSVNPPGPSRNSSPTHPPLKRGCSESPPAGTASPDVLLGNLLKSLSDISVGLPSGTPSPNPLPNDSLDWLEESPPPQLVPAAGAVPHYFLPEGLPMSSTPPPAPEAGAMPLDFLLADWQNSPSPPPAPEAGASSSAGVGGGDSSNIDPAQLAASLAQYQQAQAVLIQNAFIIFVQLNPLQPLSAAAALHQAASNVIAQAAQSPEQITIFQAAVDVLTQPAQEQASLAVLQALVQPTPAQTQAVPPHDAQRDTLITTLGLDDIKDKLIALNASVVGINTSILTVQGVWIQSGRHNNLQISCQKINQRDTHAKTITKDAFMSAINKAYNNLNNGQLKDPTFLEKALGLTTSSKPSRRR